MKIEKDFAVITIRIETKEELEQLIGILKAATIIDYTRPSRDHAYHLLKLLKEA
jgi:hypothetical protein